MTRLLVVATEFPPGPGGIGVHAYQLAVHAAGAGWDVTVAAPQEYVSRHEAEAFSLAQAFTIVRQRTGRSFTSRSLSRERTVDRLATYLRPDVVVATGNWAVWLCALSPACRRVRRLVVGHGMEFGRPSRVHRELNRTAYGNADVVVCVSNYTRGRMLAAGIQPRDVTVIPNGGDQLVYRPGERDGPRYPEFLPSTVRTILSVGNVSQRKGQDVVIRALPAIVGSGIDVHYVIVGLPSRAGELRDLAEYHGVGSRVHFMGRVGAEELVRAYQDADVFAMTSREVASGDFEGYGIAVMEAALCGKPAIVTAGSGLTEAVVDQTTGLVIPPDDPPAFALAATDLLVDDERRRTLGVNARERALRVGTWDARMAKYLELLDRLCATRSPVKPRR